MNRRAAYLTCAALGLGLAATGCGGRSGPAGTFRDTHPLPPDTMTFAMPEAGRYGGRFVLGQTTDPKTFNVMLANETSSTDVDDRMFTSLTEFDNASQTITPMLAKRWEVSADGLTWTWHLRRGAAFSDGRPITSADVLFSFEVAYDSTLHPSVQDLLTIDGKKIEVSAPDSYTVVTRIPKPYALVIPALGSLRIMPRHVLEPAYREGRFASAYSVSTPPDSIVTSGPWRVGQFVAKEKTVLVRNPFWFGVDSKGRRLPYLDELVWVVVPDQNTAVLKFESGDVDGLDNVKPEDYKRYAENQQKGDYTLFDLGPGLTSNFFWFNLNTVREARRGKPAGSPVVGPVKYAWFSNPDFRRAVSLAVDRDAIIRSVFFGEAVRNWSIMTPGYKQFYTGYVSPYDCDPARAKRLLAELGFRDRDGDGVLEDAGGHALSFTLKTNSDNVIRIAVANFIKDDLARIGIRCIPAGVDFNTLISNIREDFQYDAVLGGLGAAIPPDPGMGPNFFRSSGATHYWHMRQPAPATPEEARVDSLFDQLVSTTDMERRRAAFAEIERVLGEQCWSIMLPTLRVKLPVRNGFGNIQPSVIPHRLLWNSDRIFVKPGARKT